MSHYAKLATLAFRVVAVVLFLYAIAGSLLLAGVTRYRGAFEMLLPVVAGVMVGGILYLTAPVLGRIAAAGLVPPAAPPHER